MTGPERERATELTGTAAEKAKQAAGRLEVAATESSLSAKILAKMALDDVVKARNIGVHTTGSVVTLTGPVASEAERERGPYGSRRRRRVSRRWWTSSS